jgi:hypothetical protein
VACAAFFLVALAGFFALRERSAPAPNAATKPPVATPTEPAREPPKVDRAAPDAVKEPALVPSPTLSAAPTEVARAAALDERSLMARLRELRGSNPELTLALAREARARFKNSPDAAEQAWFVVKSLTDLGRHDEARVEGRKLLKDYPGTRWAEDAHRHLFVNPATHPAERGYGKDLDLQ